MLKPLDRRLKLLEAHQQQPDEPSAYVTLTQEEWDALEGDDDQAAAIERKYKIGDHTKIYIGCGPDDWP